jgi:hypothetical protein
MNCLFNPAHPNAGEFRLVEAIAYPSISARKHQAIERAGS